jgi:hypothetical protein
MTLPKKGSKRLVVDGEYYRWTLRRKSTNIQRQISGFMGQGSSGRIRFAVEAEEGLGSTLIVISKGWHKDMFKHWNTAPESEASITPALVTRCIRLGLKSGWHPRTRGPIHIIDLNTKTVTS